MSFGFERFTGKGVRLSAMAYSKLGRYHQKKTRDLTEEEKRQIRQRIERSEGDVYKLAEEFECVPIQVAGIKAACIGSDLDTSRGITLMGEMRARERARRNRAAASCRTPNRFAHFYGWR